MKVATFEVYENSFLFRMVIIYIHAFTRNKIYSREVLKQLED